MSTLINETHFPLELDAGTDADGKETAAAQILAPGEVSLERTLTARDEELLDDGRVALVSARQEDASVGFAGIGAWTAEQAIAHVKEESGDYLDAIEAYERNERDVPRTTVLAAIARRRTHLTALTEEHAA